MKTVLYFFFQLTNFFTKTLLVLNSCLSVPGRTGTKRLRRERAYKPSPSNLHMPQLFSVSSNPNLTPTSSSALDKSVEWFLSIYLAWDCKGKWIYLMTLTACSVTEVCVCVPHTFTAPSPTIFSLSPNGDIIIMNVKPGIKPEHMALYGWAVFIELHFTASMWQAHLSKPG